MFSLYRHQQVALSYLRVNNNFALFMEQGTGKTLVTLVRVLELLKQGAIKNYLIVAPKSALGAWIRDIEKFIDYERAMLDEAGTFINYDRVWTHEIKKVRNPKTRKLENKTVAVVRPELNKKFDCIILDEAHFIKNRTSNRTSVLLELACKADYKYILTGTPISNGQLENIWSLYCFLDPYMYRGWIYSNIFKRHMEENANGNYMGSYQEFQDRYCVLNQYYKPSSYINVKELQNIINEYCYRVKKAECLDLPEKLPDEIIKVDLKEKSIYKRLHEKSALLEYEVLAENPLSRMIKLRQLCSGHIKNENELLEFKTEKLDVLKEIIEGFEDSKKFVIFADFKYSIKQISKLLERLKIKFVVLDGDQKNKNIWREFQEKADIRGIVCQYQTASAGIDLFASDTMIFYEPTLRSQILEQARDRIHRSGQKNKCSYIHLLTKGTIEIDIYRALSGYSDFSEKLFNEYMDAYRRNYTT